MSKIFISLIFFVSIVNGASVFNWTFSHKYTLKKDEIATIVISTTESKGKDKDKLFFRWTLIVEDRVTVLMNQFSYPHQYVLYDKRSLDTLKVSLLPDDGNRFDSQTYMFLVLNKIDHKKQEVDFDVFVKDKESRILIDFFPKPLKSN